MGLGIERAGAAMVAVGAALLVAAGSSEGTTSARDLDCGDFDDQAAAQGALQPGDPDSLDADGDGIACEGLPCPCSDDVPEQPDIDLTAKAELIEVVDGDTIRVRRREKVHDVRLLGVDTPEVFGGEECGGAQASRSLRDLLSPGDEIVLHLDLSQDRRDGFGRLLRYVTLDGLDAGRDQIRNGWANVYVFERPFARLGGYRDSRNGAKRHERGIWGRCGGEVHKPLRGPQAQPPGSAPPAARAIIADPGHQAHSFMGA